MGAFIVVIFVILCYYLNYILGICVTVNRNLNLIKIFKFFCCYWYYYYYCNYHIWLGNIIIIITIIIIYYYYLTKWFVWNSIFNVDHFCGKVLGILYLRQKCKEN